MKTVIIIIAFAGMLSAVSCDNRKHSSGAFGSDTTEVDTIEQSDTPKTVRLKPADPSQVPFQERQIKAR